MSRKQNLKYKVKQGKWIDEWNGWRSQAPKKKKKSIFKPFIKKLGILVEHQDNSSKKQNKYPHICLYYMFLEVVQI